MAREGGGRRRRTEAHGPTERACWGLNRGSSQATRGEARRDTRRGAARPTALSARRRRKDGLSRTGGPKNGGMDQSADATTRAAWRERIFGQCCARSGGSQPIRAGGMGSRFAFHDARSGLNIWLGILVYAVSGAGVGRLPALSMETRVDHPDNARVRRRQGRKFAPEIAFSREAPRKGTAASEIQATVEPAAHWVCVAAADPAAALSAAAAGRGQPVVQEGVTSASADSRWTDTGDRRGRFGGDPEHHMLYRTVRTLRRTRRCHCPESHELLAGRQCTGVCGGDAAWTVAQGQRSRLASN